MTQPAKLQEPSMEEILASIRRIIADDENKPIAEIAAEAQAAAAAQLDGGRREPAEKAGNGADTLPFSPKGDPSSPRRIAGESDAAVAAVSPVPNGDAAREGDAIKSSGLGVDDDVLDLTDELALPGPVAPAFRKVEPVSDLEFAEVRSVPPRRRDPSAQRHGAAEPLRPEMMSRATVSAVESAFNSLATTVLNNNARTLEDLAKEMLRPMLKNWLDDNLPSLVERIVRTEIERVSRGR